MGAVASTLFCFKSRNRSPTSEPALSGASPAGDVPAEVSAGPVPVYVTPPPAPTTVDTAVLVVKEVLETVRDALDMFTPLKTALGLVLKVWDVYDRTTEVRDEFIELASKLAALNAIVMLSKKVADTNLQERLEAIAVAINQLAEAMQAKQDRGALSRASDSMGNVMVVKVMFRRVIFLLEVFQFDNQIRVETLLVQILERLNTSEQRNVTSVDTVQVIIAHVDQQHSSTQERYQAIIHQLSGGRLASNHEAVINNNSKKNELDGPADLDNNNANETELEIEGRGGGIVNNNSNVNRATGGGASSSGSGSPGGDKTRAHITNNNGNKSVVRRIFRKRKANPKGPTEQ